MSARTMSARTRHATLAALLAGSLALPLAALAPSAGAAPAPSAVAADPEGPALKEVTGKPVGTAVREDVLRLTDDVGTRYRDTLAREFSMVVPESELKFNRLHPRAGADPANPVDADFHLALPQPILDAAAANGQEVRGHTFVWYATNPAWVLTGEYDQDELLAIMRGHIRHVATKYADRITTWDVVNEALDTDGTLREPCTPDAPAAGADCGRSGAQSQKSVWQRIGGSEDDTHIVEAFRTARESLPASAKLYYNDFAIETSGPKADGALRIAKLLREQTAVSADGETRPLIDGIGFQTHVDTTWTDADTADFRANIKRFTDLGLETQITELDVSMPLPATDAQREIQRTVYGDIGRLCAENPACTALLTWGFTDRYQWIEEKFPGRYGDAAPLDDDFVAKPGYFGLRDGLTAAPPQP